MSTLVLGKKLLEAKETLDGSPPYESRAISLSAGDLRILIDALALVDAIRQITKST